MTLHPTHRQHWRDKQQARAQDVIPRGVSELRIRARYHPTKANTTLYRWLERVLPFGSLLSSAALRQPNRADNQAPHSSGDVLSLLAVERAGDSHPHISGVSGGHSLGLDLSPGQHSRELRLRRPQLRSCWQMMRADGGPSGPAGSMAPAQDSSHSDLELCSPRPAPGLPNGAASVALAVVHAVRTAVSRDWQRVVAGDPALLASGICCSSCLRGKYLYV